MRFLFLFCAALFSVALVSNAHAGPRCESRRWNVHIDQGDQSSKQDLLRVLDMIGSSMVGIEVTGIYSFPGLGGVPAMRDIDIQDQFPNGFSGVAPNPTEETPDIQSLLDQLNAVPGTQAICEAKPIPA